MVGCLLNGRSHNVYWKEEAAAKRLSVDGKTCLLEEENDPTQLRTPSPGKLVKFTVENGEHIKAGQPFAEVEVMKMYMPLIAQEDGTVQTHQAARCNFGGRRYSRHPCCR